MADDEMKKDSANAEAPAAEETPATEAETKKKAEKKADKTNKQDKTAKTAKGKAADAGKDKKVNPFVRMGKSIKKFFKDLRGECKKTVWPDRKTVFKSTGVVLASVAVLGLIIWGIDTGLSELIKLMLNAAKDAPNGETTTAAATAVTGYMSGFFGI